MGRSDRSVERHSSRHSRRSRSPSRRHRHSRRSSSPSDSDSSRGRHRSSRSERKRRRSPSPSSDSSLSSSEDERRKRHRKSHKKDKKHKSKKKHKKKKKSKLGSVGNEWGKYGIIHEADIFTKESEFQSWLLEIKKVNIETIPQSRRKELFIDFMDDYNTATMPHEKYYNLARWEARQHAMRMGEKLPEDNDSVNLLRDEEVLRQQHRQAAARAASSKPGLTLSKEQLDELTKVNRERVQADRMRRLGLTPKEGMGVRYEYEYE
ncbi:hypothetical protein BJV82DRAFT_670383 [Fennellomyces sp. T-0311]|nr:hypothetical protein BJV82DRAFT_670383 [Fennellomyces sp. T-0311]